MQPIVYENLLIQYEICKSYEHYAKECLENKRRDENKGEKENNNNKH